MYSKQSEQKPQTTTQKLQIQASTLYPAYESHTQLQKSLAYKSTTPQAQRNTFEPTYGIISLDINQLASTTTAVEMITSHEEAGVECDKPDRVSED